MKQKQIWEMPMMKKQIKRAVAAVAAIVMLLSAISVTAFAGQPSDPESTGQDAFPHDHIPAVDKNGEPKLTEDAAAYVQPTCVKPGCREFYQRCAVCGREIPGTRTRKEIPADENLHQPGPVAIEDVKQPTCVAAGSYYEVIRCALCGKELSGKLVKVGKTTDHVPDIPKNENPVFLPNGAIDSYESVIYCKVCGMELQRSLIKVSHILYSVIALLNKLSDPYAEPYRVCDLDDDGKITPYEAREVLRYAVGYGSRLVERMGVNAVDCDRDGKITPNDARLYLRAAVGLETD